MADLHLLDTNVLVHLVRRDAVGVDIQNEYDLLMIEPRPLISVVTAGELRSLAFQFRWGVMKLDQARFLLNYFRQTSIDDVNIVEAYAVMDAYSESIGRSMGKNDLWIAATAKITGATVLTTDRDFDHLTPQFIDRIWIPTDESYPAGVIVQSFTGSGDDQAFKAWLAQHSDGYYLNDTGKGGRMLRRVGCPHLGNAEGLVSTTYAKTCCDDREALLAWAEVKI